MKYVRIVAILEPVLMLSGGALLLVASLKAQKMLASPLEVASNHLIRILIYCLVCLSISRLRLFYVTISAVTLPILLYAYATVEPMRLIALLSVAGISFLMLFLILDMIMERIAGIKSDNEPHGYGRGTKLVWALTGNIFTILGAIFTILFTLGLLSALKVSTWFNIKVLDSVGNVIEAALMMLVGLYFRHYVGRILRFLVSLDPVGHDVYYDEHGLFRDSPGTPYLVKWSEVQRVEVISVSEISKTLTARVLWVLWAFINGFPFKVHGRSTRERGRILIVRKDGTSIVLDNVVAPSGLIPIFKGFMEEDSAGRT